MKQSATRNSKFHCGFTRAVQDVECHLLSIPADELRGRVFGIIRKQARGIMNTQENGGAGQNDVSAARQSEQEMSIAGLHDEKRQLYERLVLGEICADEYKAAKARLDEQLARLEQISSAMCSEREKFLHERGRHVQCKELARYALDENALTQQLVDLLVEKVLISPGGRVEVKWKVEGFFEAGEQSTMMGITA